MYKLCPSILNAFLQMIMTFSILNVKKLFCSAVLLNKVYNRFLFQITEVSNSIRRIYSRKAIMYSLITLFLVYIYYLNVCLFIKFTFSFINNFSYKSHIKQYYVTGIRKISHVPIPGPEALTLYWPMDWFFFVTNDSVIFLTVVAVRLHRN